MGVNFFSLQNLVSKAVLFSQRLYMIAGSEKSKTLSVLLRRIDLEDRNSLPVFSPDILTVVEGIFI